MKTVVIQSIKNSIFAPYLEKSFYEMPASKHYLDEITKRHCI